MSLEYKLEEFVGDNNLEGVKSLIPKKLDVEVKDSSNETALLSASAQGYSEIIEYLLKNGADTEAIDVDEEEGGTSLHHAIQNSHLDAVKLLLSYNANSNATACEDGTPLHYAVSVINFEMVKALVEHGADFMLKDSNGLSALELIKEEFEETDLSAEEKENYIKIIQFLSNQ